ncbi:unnamed protein product [Brassica rapa subsp. narinosa]
MMCRPSQTPHLTKSSAQIDPPKRVLGLKEGVVTPPPIHRVSAVGHRNPASGSPRIASSSYQKWPTWSSRFRGMVQQSSHPIVKDIASPMPLIIGFTRQNLFPSSSYPEGNFGGNQLLDGSISLSPLCPSQTNDLYVSVAVGLHQSFLWLRPAQALFTIFRVPTGMLTLKPFSEDQGRSAVHP